MRSVCVHYRSSNKLTKGRESRRLFGMIANRKEERRLHHYYAAIRRVLRIEIWPLSIGDGRMLPLSV